MGIRSLLRKVFGRDREESAAPSVPPQSREPHDTSAEAVGPAGSAASADLATPAALPEPETARTEPEAAGPESVVAETVTAEQHPATDVPEPREAPKPAEAPEPSEAAARKAADDLVAAAFDNPQIPKARTAPAETAEAAEPEAEPKAVEPEPKVAEAETFEPEPKVAEAETFEPEPKVAEAETFEPEPKVAEAETFEPEPKVAEAETFEPEPKVAEAEAVKAEAVVTEPEAAVTEPEAAVTEPEAVDPEPESVDPKAVEAAIVEPEPEAAESAAAEEPAAAAEAVDAEPEATAVAEPRAEVAEPEVTEPEIAEPEAVTAAAEPETVPEAPEVPESPEAEVRAEPETVPAQPEADADTATALGTGTTAVTGTDAGTDTDAPARPAVSLARVRTAAPHLVEAYKAAGAALRKEGLAGARARVYLVVDRSGSMRGYFKDGSVQRLAEQTVALAAHLDEEATVTTVFFSTDVDGVVDLTPAGLTPTRVEEINAGLGRLGRTNYHRAVEEVLAHHAKGDADRPALVVFQTDGAPESRAAAAQALAEAADRPVHWRFTAWGEEDNKAFDFLRKLTADRTATHFAGPAPAEAPHAAFYRGVLADLHL
ncbi:VWA domain-containing protein [Streptomyces filamentosus]|nr:VWA domain-containing protein [Streptomyces filamentosus]